MALRPESKNPGSLLPGFFARRADAAQAPPDFSKFKQRKSPAVARRGF
jgi:hypothetical protein